MTTDRYCNKASIPTTDLSAEELIRRGYRRISNAYGNISRIDRPDWITLLALHLRRAPSDFYKPGDFVPQGNWCDYYRSTLSKDVNTVDAERMALIPTSGHAQTAYVPVEGDHPPTPESEWTEVDLWAEIWRLRTAIKGPDGFDTWQEAAVHERILRVQAVITLNALKKKL